MPRVANNFESGQASGTTITIANATGQGNRLFDLVNIGTGAGVTFDNTHVNAGALACMIVSGSAGVATLLWNPVAFTSHYGSACFYFTGNVGTFMSFDISGGGTVEHRWHMDGATGVMYITDNTGATNVTGTVAMALNQWIRVDWNCTEKVTNAVLDLALFNTATSTTADDHIHTEVAASAAQITTIQIGSFGTGNPTFWIDDIYLDDTPYRLPVVRSQMRQG